MTPADQPWTVLYDPDCGFCKWTLMILLARDRDGLLRPVALGTDAADALLADLTPAERMASWHLISPAGRRYSGGAGAPPVLRLLPRGRPLAALLAAFPKLTDRSYRWVADHRSQLSRLVPGGSKRRAAAKLAAYEGPSRVIDDDAP